MVGLFNRLFAWFGYRLEPIKALEDERRASARAIEALERSLSDLADQRRALEQELGRLGRARAEDQDSFRAKLRDLRGRLESSRAAHAGAQEALERQTAVSAQQIAAEAEARQKIEAELWGRIATLRSSLEAERGAREAAARKAEAAVEQGAAQAEARQRIEAELWGRIGALRSNVEAERRAREAAAREAEAVAERGAAQAQAQARAIRDLWARVTLWRSRAAAAQEAQAEARRTLAETRRELERVRKHAEWLTRKLEREMARRAAAGGDAAGRSQRGGALGAAKRLRNGGRLDLAAETVERECDLSDPGVEAFYLQVLIELDDNQRLQHALRAAIERLPEQASASQEAYLQTLCRQGGLVCLEPETVELFLAKTQAAALIAKPLYAACQAMRRRLEFRRALAGSTEGHATLISVGLNCMPWTLANRWGLRSPEEFVSLFTPFAYGVHKFKVLLRALQSDFADYCEAEKLMAVETKSGHLAPMRKDTLAFWNHNLGPYWVDNGFERLREALASKAEAFRAACRAEDAVFLMSKAPIDYPAEPVGLLGELNKALEPLTGRAANRVLLWNEHAGTAGRHTVDDWTKVLNCPYPTSGYIWYDDDTADSPEALAYEGGCAGAIVESLKEWGLLRALGDGAEAGAPAAVALG